MKTAAIEEPHRAVNGDVSCRKKTRIQFELFGDRANDLERMMVDIGAATKKDVLEHALTLLEWAIDETKFGNLIGRQTPAKEFQPLVFTPLRNVARNYGASNNKPQTTGLADAAQVGFNK